MLDDSAMKIRIRKTSIGPNAGAEFDSSNIKFRQMNKVSYNGAFDVQRVLDCIIF